MLLQELFSQVLEVALREGDSGRHGNGQVSGSRSLGNGDRVGEIVGASLDLDLVMEEFFLKASVSIYYSYTLRIRDIQRQPSQRWHR